MSTHPNLLPDVAAMCDVLGELAEKSDSMTIEEAVQLRESIVELRSQAAMVLGLAETQLVTILESPREIDGNRYEVKASDGKWRPNHSQVIAKVKEVAVVNTDTGEMLSPAQAAERAALLMSNLYVANSTMPKVGALDTLGLKKWDVAVQEPGKPVLKVTPIVEAP
jgi:hypothetical protein